jgi:parallel beta-helix repeat protein
VLALALAAAAIAGPLNPPSGPVTSTMKTMTEVEPRTPINAANTPGSSTAVYVINQAGSYYLTGNVSVPSGKSGILVGTSSVTVDLNGFSIQGASGAVSGVAAGPASLGSETVKNGSIAGFSSLGVDFSTVSGGLVQNVATNSNAIGIKVYDGLVENCTGVYNNTAFAGAGLATFVQCTATNNSVAGFTCTTSAVFDRCAANYNYDRGFDVGTFTTIRNCIAEGNTYQGINCADGCNILNNQVFNNGGSNAAGIWVQGNYCTIDGNDLMNNGYGIYVSGISNLIVRNVVGSSPQSNYYIVPNNRVGVIVNTGTNAALINGNSGGGLGVSDPSANLAR